MSKEVDQNEDFDFKPLTEGLGFHRKIVDLQKEIAESGLLSSNHAGDIPNLPKLEIEEDLAQSTAAPLSNVEDVERTNIQTPLPRKEQAPELPKKPYFDSQLKIDFEENLDREVERRAVQLETHKKIPTHFTSALFDGVVAFTLSIIFLVAMMMVTKVDFLSVVANAETQIMVQASLLMMYLAILQLYLVVARSISGVTLGEWAFDVHLAERDGKKRAMFPIRVLSRSIYMVLFGVVLLPILSFIFRRDLASYLTGTQLYQIK